MDPARRRNKHESQQRAANGDNPLVCMTLGECELLLSHFPLTPEEQARVTQCIWDKHAHRPQATSEPLSDLELRKTQVECQMQVVRQRVQATHGWTDKQGNNFQMITSDLASTGLGAIQQASKGFQQQASKGIQWEKMMKWAASIPKAHLGLPKVRPGLLYVP
ncbi:MAG: hypothetical protein M1823_003159 [Watsoniomyces obsoletus]|nr:MAG: hypothetical protein M1823_003159 [Watsoniomyces obsoletus]